MYKQASNILSDTNEYYLKIHVDLTFTLLSNVTLNLKEAYTRLVELGAEIKQYNLEKTNIQVCYLNQLGLT